MNRRGHLTCSEHPSADATSADAPTPTPPSLPLPVPMRTDGVDDRRREPVEVVPAAGDDARIADGVPVPGDVHVGQPDRFQEVDTLAECRDRLLVCERLRDEVPGRSLLQKGLRVCAMSGAPRNGTTFFRGIPLLPPRRG